MDRFICWYAEERAKNVDNTVVFVLVALLVLAVALLIAVLCVVSKRGNASDGLSSSLAALDTRLVDFSQSISQQVQQNNQEVVTISTVVNSQLAEFRKENNVALDKMRDTVDEKLSKTIHDRLSASFLQVKNELDQVQHGLHEMSRLAADVGDLKKVLSNVKRRGMVGEVQLSSILAEILAPEQYVENARIKEGTQEVVEFAVKIPATDGPSLLLPIDSKFPGETYLHLVDAQNAGDKELTLQAKKQLVTKIKQEAKDISSKYIEVPKTTNFAILFLPFEGLYAEVVSQPGLIEELQRLYQVNVAGPSTMAALLNSLQLSYQTFVLQKQTDDILRVLQAVKQEMPKYQVELQKARQDISKAAEKLDHLITTRTNQMERKLRDITLPGNVDNE